MVDIGSRIKQVRLDRGLTQQDVAEQMGVSRVYYSQWESNDRRISAEQLIQFAKIFKVPLDTFEDNSPEHTLFNTMLELDALFTSAEVSQVDKDKAIKDIMEIYWKSRELTGIVVETPEVSLQHNKAKEE